MVSEGVHCGIVHVHKLAQTSDWQISNKGSGYFPVLVQNDGRLFAVVRAGAGHLGRSGYLVLIRSSANLREWERPITIVDGPEDDRNPAVAFSGTNRLLVAYQEQGSYGPDGSYQPTMRDVRVMLTWSDDQGNTWAQPRAIEGLGVVDKGSPYGKLIQSDSGSLIMNLYVSEAELGHESYLVRSHNNGETWTKPTLIAAGYNETALLKLDTGLLVAAARSSESMHLDGFVSQDDGNSWSGPVQITEARQHPADMIQLKNGWVMLFYGDRSQEQKAIKAVVSRDRCKSWDREHTVVISRPLKGTWDFGYPSVADTGDRVAVAHYWAGNSESSYDRSNAIASITYFSETEFVKAYTQMLEE